jgi:hypothetical protein
MKYLILSLIGIAIVVLSVIFLNPWTFVVGWCMAWGGFIWWAHNA